MSGERQTAETAQVCTCTEPAVACPACLAGRDRYGFPRDWRERMRREFVCPGCGKANVVVGLDSVLLETRPTVRRRVPGAGAVLLAGLVAS